MKKNRFLLFYSIAILAMLFTACKSDPTNTDTPIEETTAPVKKVPVPKFERDSAYQFVAKQVAFGPRVIGSQAAQDCKAWLVQKFKSYGAAVIEQDFKANLHTGESLDATNIIAQFNPAAKKRVVLAAHWDSRHVADSPLSEERHNEAISGADDGGSGVGVLLEVARVLQANPIEMGVDIVLFDAEDNGKNEDPYSWCLGAQHWAANLHTSPYKPKYGILLDMVGSKGARFTKDLVSLKYAGPVMDKIWKLAQNMGYSNHFVDAQTGELTDDHLFVNMIARIPMLDIINRPVNTQTGFGEYWHTHDDDMDVIDARTLGAVGQVVLATVYREANGDF